MNSTTTYTGHCPCGCGHTVTVTDGGFSSTTVTVAACSRLVAAGIADYTVRKSSAPAQAVAPTIRHRDGLVSFEGGL